MNTREIAEKLWKLGKILEAKALISEALDNSGSSFSDEAREVRQMGNQLWELGIELACIHRFVGAPPICKYCGAKPSRD